MVLVALFSVMSSSWCSTFFPSKSFKNASFPAKRIELNSLLQVSSFLRRSCDALTMFSLVSGKSTVSRLVPQRLKSLVASLKLAFKAACSCSTFVLSSLRSHCHARPALSGSCAKAFRALLPPRTPRPRPLPCACCCCCSCCGAACCCCCAACAPSPRRLLLLPLRLLLRPLLRPLLRRRSWLEKRGLLKLSPSRESERQRRPCEPECLR